ncbi:MAG: thiamine-phosphate kinase [Phycisphaerae bacterium]
MAFGERELMAWLRRQSGEPAWPVVLGIGDDMAALEVGADEASGGAGALMTSDMLLDGVHFDTTQHGLDQIGRKALACSLSDCAAMAVKPLAATVSVAWPGDLPGERIKELYEGLFGLSREFACPIIGGDTTRWGRPLAIDVAMIACRYQEHRAIRRTGAQVGDTLYVTGLLGGSLLGKHLSFHPRVRQAHDLASTMGAYLHAMMDLSDGLAMDLPRLCEASGVGAVLAERLLDKVVSDDARTAAEQDGRSPLDHALGDGEDFELLLAVAGDAPELPDVEDLQLMPIGRVVASGVQIEGRGGALRDLPCGGYDHLANNP